METKLSTNARAVLETVQTLENHPTALEVYEAVRQARPRIGMATVYRTLHQLAQSGHIQEVGHTPDGCRYDARTGRHDHIICKNCGALLDLPQEVPLSSELLKSLAHETGMEMLSHEVRVYGICPNCRERAHNLRSVEI